MKDVIRNMGAGMLMLGVAAMANAAAPLINVEAEVGNFIGGAKIGPGQTSGVKDLQSKLDDLPFRYPNAVAVDSRGNVYVVDSGNDRIVKMDANGNRLAVIPHSKKGFISTAASTGAYAQQLNCPEDAAIQEQASVQQSISGGNSCVLYVADSKNHRIAKFTCDGDYLSEIKTIGGKDLYFPQGIGIGKDGRIGVADTMNHRVVVLSKDEKLLNEYGDNQLAFPKDVDFDSKGSAWISDFENHRVVSFDKRNRVAREIKVAGNGYMKHPVGLVIDNKDRLWVTEMDRHQVDVIDLKTSESTTFGQFVDGISGNTSEPYGFDHPKGIAVDPNGLAWVVTPGSHSVHLIKYSDAASGKRDTEK